jgi:beta-lactam-binding protein with PASTA domain
VSETSPSRTATRSPLATSSAKLRPPAARSIPARPWIWSSLSARSRSTYPNVIGQARATAEGNITAAGLSVGNVTEQNSDTVAAGNVISQAPAAGSTVDTGSAVNLVVSLGPVQVDVPNVVGQAQATAEGNITAAGLSVGNVTEQNSDTVAAGNVISQDPAGGSTVDAGSAVDLVVSLGPAELSATLTGVVTDLEGNPLSDVTVKIGQATVFVQTERQRCLRRRDRRG